MNWKNNGRVAGLDGMKGEYYKSYKMFDGTKRDTIKYERKSLNPVFTIKFIRTFPLSLDFIAVAIDSIMVVDPLVV